MFVIDYMFTMANGDVKLKKKEVDEINDLIDELIVKTNKLSSIL